MDLTFIDTGAFIALFDAPDDRHRQAKVVYSALMAQRSALVTSNHVIDETCTWLLRHTRNGHEAAMMFGKAVATWVPVSSPSGRISFSLGPGKLVVVYSTHDIERAAWDIFARYDTAGFSFTDCVSFAVMQSLGITKAFSFDAHFDVLGFERL